jgi:hypothetical protein
MPAARLNTGRDLIEESGPARDQYRLRALCGKRLSDAAAYAVARTGDDCDLVLQLFAHAVSDSPHFPFDTK